MTHQDDSPAMRELQRKLSNIRAHMMLYPLTQLNIPKLIDGLNDLNSRLDALLVAEGRTREDYTKESHAIPV